MSNKQRFAVVLLALLALATSHAMTRLWAMPAATQEGGDDDAGVLQEAVNRELEAFRAAQVTLRQAMGIAEKLHIGSRTAEISFDGASGSPVYRVKTVQGDRLWEDVIDAKTGDTIGAGKESRMKDLSTDDRNNVIALRTVRHELLDAILIAERSASGTAMGGGLMNENGKLNFVVIVVSGSSDLKQVILEPPRASGRGSVLRHRSP